MYQANIPTLLLILSLIKILLGGLILFLKKSSANNKGINYWAYGSFLTAIGLFIYSITPYPALPHVSFFYSAGIHLFVYTGDVLFLAGFWVFFDKPIKKFVFIVPLINIAIATVFTFGYYSVWMRFSFTSFVGFILYLYSAYEIRRFSKIPWSKKLLCLISYVYLFYAFIQIVRFGIGIIVKPENPTNDSIVSVFLFAFASLTMILLTFSIVVIIVAKMNAALEDEIKNKNRLHSIIAHDMRNSMSNIVNNVTLLKRNIGFHEKDEMNMSVEHLKNSSLNSRFLMENLFHWSQSQLKEIEVKPTQCNISQIIENSINIITPLADEKEIKISFKNSNNSYALCDEDMMSIVFRNILSNAIKFTEINGFIIISVVENVDKVSVSIADSGIGMSEDSILLFWQGVVKQSKPGTNNEKGYGFGLLLCKEFIHQNNGHFNIVSEQGKGSNFIISLPKK